mgnify:CR=1 FL=1
MLNFVLSLLREYGLGVTNLAVISFGLCKIATNHLAHMDEKIDTIGQPQLKKFKMQVEKWKK